MRKRSSLLLCISIALALLSPAAAGADAPSSWAQEEVTEAIALGFVPPELQSAYQSNITRAEFAKIAIFFLATQYNYRYSDAEQECRDFLISFLELSEKDGAPVYVRLNYRDQLSDDISPEGTLWEGYLFGLRPFWDLDIDSLTNDEIRNINAAYVFGIIGGRGDGGFYPNDPITRQEAAAILLRTYQVYNTAALPTVEAAVFSDQSELGAWAADAVSQMVHHGVMTGVGEGVFAPTAYYTREQCITTFLRLYRNMPTSRVHGNIPRFASMEDEIARIDNGLYHVRHRCGSDAAVILFGMYGGMMHAPENGSLHILYKDGGKRCVDLPGSGSAIDMSSFTVTQDQTQLLFRQEVPMYSQQWRQFTLNIATGEFTVEG